jgi:hypothetical protein
VKAYDSKGKSVKDMFIIEVYPLENENTNNKVRNCVLRVYVSIRRCVIIMFREFQTVTAKM